MIKKILVTCPPMIGLLEEFKDLAFSKYELELVPIKTTQTLDQSELIKLSPLYDGWIIGDDEASLSVLEAGFKGRLRAAVKWGIGIDNIDLNAIKKFKIPFSNTPGMFGGEVADLAVGYVIALSRQIIQIHQAVLDGEWPKPIGISLAGRTVGIVGFGDIGRNIAKRLLAMNMEVFIYDPYLDKNSYSENIKHLIWPSRINECDFLILACSLNKSNYHLINSNTLSLAKKGVRIINVSRGALIDEEALVESLANGKVNSAALDVFEVEPLQSDSLLRNFKQCIFGSHNASNTTEGVARTSIKAIELMHSFLIEREY